MIDAVKIPVAENTSAIQDLEKRFNLKTLDEFKYFALEICDMVDEGKKMIWARRRITPNISLKLTAASKTLNQVKI